MIVIGRTLPIMLIVLFKPLLLLSLDRTSESFLTPRARQPLRVRASPGISIYLSFLGQEKVSIWKLILMLAVAGGGVESPMEAFFSGRLLFPGTCRLVKQPSLLSSPITLREHLNDRHRASVYPVGLMTHTMSVNTPYHLPAYAHFFFFPDVFITRLQTPS